VKIPTKVDSASKTLENTSADNDEERYSRQVYTLGAKAHGLIRSSTVYLDGPVESGLMYETAKNLALSGVRHIVIVESKVDFYDSKLDDLGNAYKRSATAEAGSDDLSNLELLVDYLRRLNPSIGVSHMQRSELETAKASASPHILMSLERSTAKQIELNDLAREKGWPFISVETAGVYGKVFCDFGSTFTVDDSDGETSFSVPLDRIEKGEDGLYTVHCIEGEKHDVSKGDLIEFLMRDGSSYPIKCNVAKVDTPFRFRVTVESESDSPTWLTYVNRNAVMFRRIKVPQEVSFVSLRDAYNKESSTVFAVCDLEKSFDSMRRESVMACFSALHNFVELHERAPTHQDAKTMEDIIAKSARCSSDQISEDLVTTFARIAAAKFVPVQAILASISAQEALKAASHLYYPVRQFLLYDCDEVLSESCSASQSSYGVGAILGDEIAQTLSNEKLFVVGSGAIGCELLKNLAAMRAGCGLSGKIIVTDMDTIEKSNLSRQLLFRDSNIGDFKSAAAKEAALRFTVDMNIEAHSAMVGDDADGPFDAVFWSKGADIILNALDNVDARLYMDAKCVANRKAMIDAGTMGSKGNVQVVVPFQSESYSSSADPPEPAIPLCTVKSFPYTIAHTIQWGRELFDELFQRRVEQAESFREAISTRNVSVMSASLVSDRGAESAVQVASQFKRDVLDSQSANPSKSALKWASGLLQRFFHDEIQNLLREHPLDSLDEDGEPFWSGPRRPPSPLRYIPGSQHEDQIAVNQNIRDFVLAACRLRVESLMSSRISEIAEIELEKAVLVAEHDSMIHPIRDNGSEDVVVPLVKNLLEEVSSSTDSIKSSALEFEKDDETNGHVDFVTAASNLRALCYGIPPVDRQETRRVAGSIIPAMITTTALVSALSCVELVKVAQKKPLRSYRNAFVNLALPFFAFTAPLPAEEIDGPGGLRFTLWDRFFIEETEDDISSGGKTVQSLLSDIEALVSSNSATGVSVASVSVGPCLIYANFLHDEDEETLATPIWELISNAMDMDESPDERDEPMEAIPLGAEGVELSVVVEDTGTNEDMELPSVFLKRFNSPVHESCWGTGH